MLSMPGRLPTAVGVKVSATVQLVPGASDAAQVLEVTAKSPVAAGAPMVTGAPPLFVAVNVTEEDAVPTASDPKL
jgi:hypothetical protein